MDELTWQRKLVKQCKSEGGHGWKLSNRFFANILDLCLVLKGNTAFIECKRISYKRLEIGHRIPVKMTEGQRLEGKSIQRAGGTAKVAVLIEFEGSTTSYVFITDNFDREYAMWGVDDFIRRKRGEPWPISIMTTAQ